MHTLQLWMFCSQILFLNSCIIHFLPVKVNVQALYFSKAKITNCMLCVVPSAGISTQQNKKNESRFMTEGFLWFQFDLFRIFLFIKSHIDIFFWTKRSVNWFYASVYVLFLILPSFFFFSSSLFCKYYLTISQLQIL